MAELGIDLGTAHTTISISAGDSLREASVVAFDRNRRIVSIGMAAAEMEGRVGEHLQVLRPIAYGTIDHFDAARALIVHMLERTAGTRRYFGRFVASVPGGASDIERKALNELLRGLGARSVRLVPKALAMARGCGIAASDRRAHMLVDFGAGTTEIAIVSFGDIIAVESLRLGGDAMDAAIMQSVRQRHRLLIGRPTAERLKIALGYVGAPPDRAAFAISGYHLSAAGPSRVRIEEELVGAAIRDVATTMLNAIDDVLAGLAPDVANDIGETGIILCGAAAQLPGLAEAITERTQMPARLAAEPELCTARGARMLADETLPVELLHR